MTVTLIDAAQARQIPPHLCAPPMRTNDAKTTGVGAAHGRVLPLVGNTRPYLYDVTIVGTDERIYADRITDVIGVLIGDNYAATARQIEELDVTDLGDSGGAVELGDLLPTELAEEAATDTEVSVDRYAADGRIQRRQQTQELLYELALLRTAFATTVRIALQQAINADAVANGLWDNLTDDEKTELTLSASESGGFPVGMPTEVPVIEDPDNSPHLVSMICPQWRAETPLVLNSGDYNPWTEAPFIESIREAVDSTGTPFEYPTDENVVTLTIDTEQEFLDSLVAAGYLTVDTRPAFQPSSSIYQNFDDDPIANPYMRVQGDTADSTDRDGNS